METMWFAIEEYDDADFADVEETYDPVFDEEDYYESEEELARGEGFWIDDDGNWVMMDDDDDDWF